MAFLLFFADAMNKGMLPSVKSEPTTTREPIEFNEVLALLIMASVDALAPKKTNANTFASYFFSDNRLWSKEL